LVGGLADWFAVTALFRHPLGLPIPHTAIIRERKDQFGETLGRFVQENFLSHDVIAERLRAARVADRAAAWLATPANADRVARRGLAVLADGLDLVDDADVHRLLDEEVDHAVRSIPVTSLAGRALSAGIEAGHHKQMVESALQALVRILDERRDSLRARFGEASPWWLPGAAEDRIFDRLLDGARLLIGTVAADPDHELRVELDVRLRELADRLQHDPVLADRAREVLASVVASPDVRAWTRSLWTDMVAGVAAQATPTAPGDEPPILRTRLAEAIVAMAGQLGSDPALQARLLAAVEAGVEQVTSNYQEEISSLISATVARWDAEETSDKLELLLGRDLQFIRVNGTVVGGLAGLALHAVAVALG
jgi:uncharacterized membrane-anchored protein YjiN (DUF445 family)